MGGIEQEKSTSSHDGHFARWLQSEFSPCSTHSPGVILSKPATLLFHLLCWLIAVGTVAHILFGTSVFSSLTFIAVPDALPIAARYLISGIVCRGILMYELSGMRETTAVRTATATRGDSLHLGDMTKYAAVSEARVVDDRAFRHVPVPVNETDIE